MGALFDLVSHWPCGYVSNRRAEFRQFLEGAQHMDRHFKTAPLRKNIPIRFALLGFWHRVVCGYASRAVIPYAQRLARFPAYLQQLDMESNGKQVSLDGKTLTFSSGPVVWGDSGTNGQHAFFSFCIKGQMLFL